MTQKLALDSHDVINQYFAYIRELRNGKKEVVDKLIDLWAEDGIFEFSGAPAVKGTYKGRNAINVLYKNRVNACGMPLKLEGNHKTPEAMAVASEVALGAVETHVNRIRTLGTPVSMVQDVLTAEKPHRVAVGWTTTIETDDKRGFNIGGSHTFTFKDGKISALKVSVSVKPQVSEGLSLDNLTVKDIGRLSLAAWAVV